MNNSNETLRPIERFRGTGRREALPHPQIDPAHVEQVFARRKEMLLSIKLDIGRALFEAISAKVDYENQCLLGIIESDARMTETRKRLNKVLKSEYFVRRPLDTNII